MNQFECPRCQARLGKSEELKVGDKVECPECGYELRVLSVNPLKLGRPEKQERKMKGDAEDILRKRQKDPLPEAGVKDEANPPFKMPEHSRWVEEEPELYEKEEEEGEE